MIIITTTTTIIVISTSFKTITHDGLDQKKALYFVGVIPSACLRVWIIAVDTYRQHLYMNQTVNL